MISKNDVHSWSSKFDFVLMRVFVVAKMRINAPGFNGEEIVDEFSLPMKVLSEDPFAIQVNNDSGDIRGDEWADYVMRTINDRSSKSNGWIKRVYQDQIFENHLLGVGNESNSN